jgi:hypothetical protein
MPDRLTRGVLCAVATLAIAIAATPASAQLNDQLKAYTGVNAEGYLEPLSSAFGAALNDAFFYSADIPTSSLRITLEFPVMGVIFSDDDRTFSAVPEGGFQPDDAVEAPTIIGSGEAEVVTNTSGGSYAFPGGFDLNSFGLVVPQLRVGGIRGTEAVIRWFAIDPDTDSELGKISLFGFGIRHSISQYFDSWPLEVAGGFMWQSFKAGENVDGDDLISSDALSIGVQGSKTFEAGFIDLVPFAGLSFDTFSMDVEYTSEVGDEEETISLSFDSENTVHLTLGAGIQLPVAHVHGAFNIASQSSFNFGIALGNVGF